jgi:predicted SprT family Zn-dependent metalloprotease
MPKAQRGDDLARERALVRELAGTYVRLNEAHFKSALRAPQLALSDASSFLGRWYRETRTIELSRAFVLSHDWGSVVEVLKHEMAHQFVHEVLRESEAAHGPAFRAVCERLGIDARAQGLPQRRESPEQDKLLARVHKLLALAQSDNQHEAEAAAAAAQRLMLRHNLEMPERDERDGYAFKQLGRVTGRVTEWERRLGNILRDHFFVDIIWVPAYLAEQAKRGSVMEAIGSHENLELAAYVYEFLARTAEKLWLAHKKAEGITKNADRLPYYAGVMSGFAQKLDQQARAHRSDGLVWVPHQKLTEYTRKRHPYLRTVKHQGHRRGDAFQEGQRAGRDVVLHRGITERTGGSDKRLLRG